MKEVWNQRLIHQLKIICHRKTGRSSAYHGDLLAGGFRQFLGWDVLHMINSHTLQTPDINRRIQKSPAAAALAGMLTDQRTDRRQRIIVNDQLHRIGIPAFSDQSYIPRNVDMGRAGSHTRNAFRPFRKADAFFDVGYIFVPKSRDAFQDHFGGFRADRAVCGNRDVSCQMLDLIQVSQSCFIIQHLFQQKTQLSEAHPAGCTFSAALCHIQFQKSSGNINRAGVFRIKCHVTVHVFIDTVQYSLHLIKAGDRKSAQWKSPSPKNISVKPVKICLKFRYLLVLHFYNIGFYGFCQPL